MQFGKQTCTPWDDEELGCLHGNPVPPPARGVVPREMIGRRLNCKDVIHLCGRWVIDPSRATSEGVRRFMWEGLRVLRTEAKARGLSEDQVDRLLLRAFENFHDAAESIWTAMKTVQSIARAEGSSCHEFTAPADPLHWWGVGSMPVRWYEHSPGFSTNWAEPWEGGIPVSEHAMPLGSSDPFIACEEDRTVAVKVDVSKPLTFLDPDADLLASFEP